MKKIFFAVSLAAASMAANASVTTFDDNAMNLVGAADMTDGSIQMVKRGASGGAAWLTSPVSTANSFDVNFAFSLKSSGSFPMADGITFALQNGGTDVLGQNGGNLGYNGLGAVGSVIQTWYNNTAGLNIDGNAYHTQSAPANLGRANLVTGTENVKYDAANHTLSMTGTLLVDGTSHAIRDLKEINLATKFGSTMNMGFTGASGGSYSDERITSFSVSAVPEPETYAMLLAGLGLMGFMSRRRKNS